MVSFGSVLTYNGKHLLYMVSAVLRKILILYVYYCLTLLRALYFCVKANNGFPRKAAYLFITTT